MLGGRLTAPAGTAIASPAKAMALTWTRPSSPTPITLPASRWRARIALSTTSTTREDFSEMTLEASVQACLRVSMNPL